MILSALPLALAACVSDSTFAITEPRVGALASRSVQRIATDLNGAMAYCSAVPLPRGRLLTCAHCLPETWRPPAGNVGTVTLADGTQIMIPLFLGENHARWTGVATACGEDWVALAAAEGGAQIDGSPPPRYDPFHEVAVGDVVYMAGFPIRDGYHPNKGPPLTVLRARVESVAPGVFTARLSDSAGRFPPPRAGIARRLVGLSGGAALVVIDEEPVVIGMCQTAIETGVPGISTGIQLRVIRPTTGLESHW